jgi:hypothetical protein
MRVFVIDWYPHGLRYLICTEYYYGKKCCSVHALALWAGIFIRVFCFVVHFGPRQEEGWEDSSSSGRKRMGLLIVSF